MLPAKRTTVINSPEQQWPAVAWLLSEHVVPVAAGLDLGPGCVGIDTNRHYCRAGTSTQNSLEGPKLWRQSLRLCGRNLLILHVMSTHTGGMFRPVQVYKVSLFSDWCVVACGLTDLRI